MMNDSSGFSFLLKALDLRLKETQVVLSLAHDSFHLDSA
jgi:hypothetical protein